MNKPIDLNQSILELKRLVMYKFWYDFVKLKYDKKAKLCYMHTDSYLTYKKTDDIYKDIVEGVETKFYTSNYELNRPLQKEKSKKGYWFNER